jgi:hypothetical protein
MMRSLLRLLPALLLFAAGISSAQETDESPATAGAPGVIEHLSLNGTVVIETNLPDGMVFVGNEPLGPAGAGVFELPLGEHTLTLREPNAEAWRLRSSSAEVVVDAGSTQTVRLDVPYRYRVESFPYGAVVTLEGEGASERLGKTPLDLEVDRPLEGTLVVEKAGHTVERQRPGASADNHYAFVLRPLDYEVGETEIALGEPRAPNQWIDVAALGLAVGAGAVAVYYKFKGDDEFDEYARTGDPAQRSDFERYDTYSAIALGAMQVGIGVFAIRLVLR